MKDCEGKGKGKGIMVKRTQHKGEKGWKGMNSLKGGHYKGLRERKQKGKEKKEKQHEWYEKGIRMKCYEKWVKVKGKKDDELWKGRHVKEQEGKR